MGNDGGVSLDPLSEPIPLMERTPTRRASVIAASGLATSLLLTTLTILPSPYAIAEPGLTVDTLASDAAGPYVAIDGAQTYDTTGQLRLTTVSFSDAGSQWFTAGRVLESYFSSARAVEPSEWVFGSPEDEDEEKAASAQQWITSQESATVSALEHMGVRVPATLEVAGVVPESLAVDVLLEGDVIVAIDGKELVTYTDLTDSLAARSPGDEITVTVVRNGEESDVTFGLIALPDDPNVARMGIYVDPQFDLPVDVTVGIERIGGPSAGLMFALAILDKLSPEDELHGAKVAGTGEIDVDGQVYPIGGIRMKMLGARADGADFFLAPVENCDEVLGHIPDGLAVYAVDDLDDAYSAIVAIGSDDTASLPTCSAA